MLFNIFSSNIYISIRRVDCHNYTFRRLVSASLSLFLSLSLSPLSLSIIHINTPSLSLSLSLLLSFFFSPFFYLSTLSLITDILSKLKNQPSFRIISKLCLPSESLFHYIVETNQNRDVSLDLTCDQTLPSSLVGSEYVTFPSLPTDPGVTDYFTVVALYSFTDITVRRSLFIAII